MYFSLTIILAACIFSIDSTKIFKKFCVNCKYYITDGLSDKCRAFQKDDFTFLVRPTSNNNNSSTIDLTNYYYCTTARSIDSMCGIQGIHYVQKKEV